MIFVDYFFCFVFSGGSFILLNLFIFFCYIGVVWVGFFLFDYNRFVIIFFIIGIWVIFGDDVVYYLIFVFGYYWMMYYYYFLWFFLFYMLYYLFYNLVFIKIFLNNIFVVFYNDLLLNCFIGSICYSLDCFDSMYGRSWFWLLFRFLDNINIFVVWVLCFVILKFCWIS